MKRPIRAVLLYPTAVRNWVFHYGIIMIISNTIDYRKCQAILRIQLLAVENIGFLIL